MALCSVEARPSLVAFAVATAGCCALPAAWPSQAYARKLLHAVVKLVRAAIHLVEKPGHVLSTHFVDDGEEVVGRGMPELVAL
ncbi:MAG TPA: hypothetical protein VFP65_04085, partial [Anaeromyxobacteraceae bacterium]|nr:hypothetical protein [Anaeromyxobacteraceae bacterium]